VFMNGHACELIWSSELLCLWQVITAFNLPVSVLLKSTIPEIEPAKWSRNYGTANVVLCPLLILYIFTSLVSLNRHIVFLAPSLRLPIWVLMLLQGGFMGAAYSLAVKRPPAHGQLLAVVVAFIMSVFWISVIAGELLGCLVTLGIILGVSPALLGLTVLAWGNSIGDLVADVAVARVGQPTMAVAGCFAGPMFNMLVGLGSALCLRTAKDFPVGYQLDHHPGILVAFGFLTLNLLGTLSVVSSSKFQVTRIWGKCLISWYVLFMVVSVVVAQMASAGSPT
jgi:sodium/potassium/calcium exchanger 6